MTQATQTSTLTRARRETFDINLTPVETVLWRSSLVALGEYRCGVGHPQFAGGGPQKCPFVVFPRTSVRITRLGGKPVVYTQNMVSLYNVGEIYRREAISAEGDRCDWIAVAPALLCESTHEGGTLPGTGAFDGPAVFSSPALYAAQRALFRALRVAPNLSILEVEERALAIVDAVQRAAAREWSNTRRHEAEQRYAGRAPAIVDATVELLANEYHSRLGIEDISARVHCSPGYLSRLFRRSTGFSLHGYQQQLRLRASLELLADAKHELSDLALYLGFSSHSHFSSAFRNVFGMTPTEFCCNASAALLRLMRAVLEEIPGEGAHPA